MHFEGRAGIIKAENAAAIKIVSQEIQIDNDLRELRATTTLGEVLSIVSSEKFKLGTTLSRAKL